MNCAKVVYSLLFCLAVTAGCAPQAEPVRYLTAPPPTDAPPPVPETGPQVVVLSVPPPKTIESGTSGCVSPSGTSLATMNATRAVRSLNANTSANMAALEYLLSRVDPDLTCGTLFHETASGQVRSIRVYKLTRGAAQYSAGEGQLWSVLSQLQLVRISSVVVYTDISGLPPKILLRAGWRSEGVEIPKVRGERVGLYSKLATSGRSTFLSARSSRPTINDRFNCADFSTQAAAQAFFSGLPGDVNRLDGDNDGIACESPRNTARPYRIALEDLPQTFTVVHSPEDYFLPPSGTSSGMSFGMSSDTSYSSGSCYVSSYTRKDGTHVSGYSRSC